MMRGETEGVLWDCGVQHVSTWIFNCYVVEDGGAGRPFLVDAGLRSLSARALTRLRSLGKEPEQLVALVATHGHTDHVSGFPWLAKESKAPVYFPEKVQDYLRGEEPRHPGLRALLKITPVFFSQPFSFSSLLELAKASGSAGYGPGPFVYPTTPSGFLSDGATVPGAPAWKVFSARGHTDDSLCFYNETTRTLLSGDAILTCDGRAWFTPELVDGAAASATEERLRSLRVDYLLPGHGVPLRGKDLLRDARVR